MKAFRLVFLLAGLPAGLFAGLPLAGQDPLRPAVRVAIVLHGEAAGGSVEFGKAFELDVVRRWARGEAPPAWSSQILAPLTVDELAVTTADDGAETIETRRCRAYVFQRGAVTLLPESDTARTLLVDSCLPDGDAGVLELPALPPLEVRAGRRLLARVLQNAAAAGLLVWVALLALRAFRRRQGTPSQRQHLQLAVEAIGATVPATRAEHRSDAVAGTRVLREAVRLSPGASLDAAAMAAQELLDGVKFAGRPLSAEQRAQVLDTLRRAVAAVPEDAA